MAAASKQHSNRELAIANLSLNCGNYDPEDLGPAITDEEMAVLAEGRADQILGAKRKNQLLAQISNDPSLLEEWVRLYEFVVEMEQLSQPEPKPEPKPEASAGWLASIKDWFEPILVPQTAMVTGLASLVAVVFTLQFTGPSGDPVASAVHSGEALPSRASTGTYSPDPGAELEPEVDQPGATVVQKVAQVMNCSDTQVESQVQSQGQSARWLCYSNTSDLQNWFLLDSNSNVLATPAPVDADSVMSLQFAGAKLLIEYVKGAQFHLGVLEMETKGSTAQFKLLHSDQVEGGFFEDIQFGDGNLSYVIKRDNGDVERKAVDIK